MKKEAGEEKPFSIINIIKEGPEVFNLWREQNLDQEVVIENADFKTLNLSGINFTGGIISNSDFSYCNLYESVFRGAIIKNCCFDFAEIINCGFNAVKILQSMPVNVRIT